jgi:hypothetical protein
MVACTTKSFDCVNSCSCLKRTSSESEAFDAEPPFERSYSSPATLVCTVNWRKGAELNYLGTVYTSLFVSERQFTHARGDD